MNFNFWILPYPGILFCLILVSCANHSNHTNAAEDSKNEHSEGSVPFEDHADSISGDTVKPVLPSVEEMTPKKAVVSPPPKREKPIQEKGQEVEASATVFWDSARHHDDQIEIVQEVEKQTASPVDTLMSMELDKKQVSKQIDPIHKDRPVYPDHHEFDQLLRAFVSSEGKVNYTGFLSQKTTLELYLTQLKTNPPLETWARNEQLAFWINAYNAFTIKLILDYFPVESILDIENGKPWDKKWIQIGEATYSLNQIENEIIRPQFNEPRIHFAINCAAASCPSLSNQAFTSTNLDQLLDKQTRAFINDDAFNQISNEKVVLSKIFEWYAPDFPDLISFLNRYVAGKVNTDAEIQFEEYNWALNQ